MLTDAVCFLSGESRVLYFHHITVSGWWRVEPTTQGPHFLNLGFASRQTGGRVRIVTQTAQCCRNLRGRGAVFPFSKNAMH